MINSETADQTQDDEAAIADIVRAGAAGAVMIAGISTALVIGLWFAFYLLVFIPRAMAP